MPSNNLQKNQNTPIFLNPQAMRILFPIALNKFKNILQRKRLIFYDRVEKKLPWALFIFRVFKLDIMKSIFNFDYLRLNSKMFVNG